MGNPYGQYGAAGGGAWSWAAGRERTLRQRPTIEVTVIGGYLGAGKTTLVNHLLRCATGRIAVLVNDFGDVDIDGALIESHDGSTISLTNGCICCSLVDGFAAALATVRSAEPMPERLVIEASGVADPASVAAYGHAPGLRLDATVVVVDAETIRARSRDEYVGDTVVGQLSSADIVVLNKLDLVDERAAVATRSWLRQAAPHAAIIDAVDSAVDPRVLLGSVDEPVVEPGRSEPAFESAEVLYQSRTWTAPGAVDRDWLEALLDSLPTGIVRTKGVVALTDRPGDPVVVQAVGRRWTIRPLSSENPARGSSGAPGQLVFIGLHGAFDDSFEASLG